MPEIGHLTRPKPVHVSIDLGDGEPPLELDFDASKITPRWMGEAEKRDNEQDALSLPKALADVILSWDVTNEGQAFEPTAENISIFNYSALRSLLEKIITAAVPASEEGNVSSRPSSTPPSASTEPPETSPNGAATSTSPVPSASLSQT